MSSRLFWRSLGVQTGVVGLIFVVLLVFPLDRGFFRDWGAVTGPLAWITASLVTWRLLDLQARAVAIAAVGGGAIGFAAGLGVGHGPGLLLSLACFAALCAAVRDGT